MSFMRMYGEQIANTALEMATREGFAKFVASKRADTKESLATCGLTLLVDVLCQAGLTRHDETLPCIVLEEQSNLLRARMDSLLLDLRVYAYWWDQDKAVTLKERFQEMYCGLTRSSQEPSLQDIMFIIVGCELLKHAVQNLELSGRLAEDPTGALAACVDVIIESSPKHEFRRRAQ